MKLFHLSDLHIGLRLINRDLSEDQAHVLDQIADYARAERPDAIVVAGDLYDKAIPSADAVTLFDRFLLKLTEAAPNAEIMMISGNHDSAPRINLFRNVLSRQRVHMIGLPPMRAEETIERVTLTDEFGPVHFWLLPFVRPSMVRAAVGVPEGPLSYDEAVRRLLGREEIDETARNVLVSHQFYLPAGTDAESVERMDSEVRTIGNIDQVSADVLAPFDYAALGHIHKPMSVGDARYRYCGTPLACSVSEAGQRKGVIVAELFDKGDVRTRVLPLTPLRQVRVLRGTLAEVLAQPSEDYVTVVLTDTVDLDVIDMQDRLHHAFPNLLEIRREGLRAVDYTREAEPEAALDPFELCCAFLRGPDEEEAALLQDVINAVREGDA